MAMTPNPTGNYIKEVTLPSGTKYEIVDEGARTQINAMSSYTTFIGVVSSATPISDGSSTSSVLVGSTTITAVTGNIAIYKASATATAQEFIFDGSKWQFFGDISAQNLGGLAYTSTASGSYVKFKSVNVGTNTVNSTGSFTPSGGVTLTKATSTLAISSTTTDPGAGNTANYWIYQPGGTLSITSGAITSTSGDFLTGVTGRSVASPITTANPTSATVTGGINYTSVIDHNLNLCYLVSSSTGSVSASTSASALKTVTKPTYSGGFTGTKVYVKPLTVTVATAATFTGTAATVSVKSTAQFVNSVTSTTESGTVKVIAST